jgi:hypothetical protein
MTVVFEDGEPVDPQKLRDLQAQIDAIKLTANESYDLSQTTANSVTTLSVMHLRADSVSFENGLKKGPNSIDIDLTWGPNYEALYTVATPRIDPNKMNIRWGISGADGNQKLYVWSESNQSGKITFHWLSAGKKRVSG